MRPAATQNTAPALSCSHSKAMMAPTNGAAEKYAPVRAVPICRNAVTNKARLTP